MNISRVCELPSDLNLYTAFVSRYQKSDKSDWIEQGLKIQDKQQKVRFGLFAKTINKLVEYRWDRVFRKHKEAIFGRPFAEWYDYIE